MTSEKQPKVVLITGCSKGGIGHALCEEYARKGCIVYATARRLETMQDLADAGMRTLRLDVTNNEDIKRVVDTVIEEQGRIDILVNNAGVSFSAPVIEQDLEQAKRLFDTNVWGVVALTQVVAPHMCRRRSGMIVNIGSIAGLAFLPWHSTYCASKASLHAYSDAMRRELKQFNVKVLLVAAGFVQTEIIRKSVDSMKLADDSLYKSQEKKIVKMISLAHDLRPVKASKFSKKLVKTTLKRRPPYVHHSGRLSTPYRLMQFTPHRFNDWAIPTGLKIFNWFIH